MKHILFIISLFCGATLLPAQSVTDGLLYSQQGSYGTARYRALSGAFNALGGDLSAIGNNPAGSTVFANHFTGFSLNYQRSNSDADFNSTLSSQHDNDFTINQAGIVLVYLNRNKKSAINKMAFGINYDNTRNYDNKFIANGINNNSISSYFIEFANGIDLDNFVLRDNETISGLYQFLGESQGFAAQQGLLGYQSFIIDPFDTSDPLDLTQNQYFSNTGVGDFQQQLYQNSSGSQGKVTFNGAIELIDRISLGVNINAHYINYQRANSFIEHNNNTALVNSVRFNNNLEVIGSGVSFQIGAIARVTQSLRLGATYESPTWFTMEESLLQSVTSISNDGNGGTITDIIAPNVVTVFAPYDLRSPGSVTGSLAYVFGKTGLISIDYSSKDYSNMRFRPSFEPTFSDNNDQIRTGLDRANTLRIGGEYRIQNWSLRAGYRTEDSPYQNKDLMSDLSGYSFGLAYSWGVVSVGVSYDRSEQTFSRQLFDTGLTTPISINNIQKNIVATLDYNF